MDSTPRALLLPVTHARSRCFARTLYRFRHITLSVSGDKNLQHNAMSSDQSPTQRTWRQ